MPEKILKYRKVILPYCTVRLILCRFSPFLNQDVADRRPKKDIYYIFKRAEEKAKKEMRSQGITEKSKKSPTGNKSDVKKKAKGK